MLLETLNELRIITRDRLFEFCNKLVKTKYTKKSIACFVWVEKDLAYWLSEVSAGATEIKNINGIRHIVGNALLQRKGPPVREDAHSVVLFVLPSGIKKPKVFYNLVNTWYGNSVDQVGREIIRYLNVWS